MSVIVKIENVWIISYETNDPFSDGDMTQDEVFWKEEDFRERLDFIKNYTATFRKIRIFELCPVEERDEAIRERDEARRFASKFTAGKKPWEQKKEGV